MYELRFFTRKNTPYRTGSTRQKNLELDFRSDFPVRGTRIAILAENVLTLVILYRSQKLPFQIRTLAMSLTTSDCILGLGVSLPKRAVEVALR